jgi:hypothetical protein
MNLRIVVIVVEWDLPNSLDLACPKRYSCPDL